MRVNEHTRLVGRKVILVPYEKRHVEKYHGWMQDEELRRLTASEQLSLDEEYEMQKSWREDDDKCTFIVLSRELLDGAANEISSMVGDVNIFINDSTGELTTMIAEPAWRRKGLGREAVLLMLKYAWDVIGLRVFEAKISDDNTASLDLFQKLGFAISSRSEEFHEYTLSIGAENVREIIANLEVKVQKYEGIMK